MLVFGVFTLTAVRPCKELRLIFLSPPRLLKDTTPAYRTLGGLFDSSADGSHSNILCCAMGGAYVFFEKGILNVMKVS
jgi:hypothetical protein